MAMGFYSPTAREVRSSPLLGAVETSSLDEPDVIIYLGLATHAVLAANFKHLCSFCHPLVGVYVYITFVIDYACMYPAL